MAAEVMAEAGLRVTVFERLPSPARKLLMAGRGGLNITHSEKLPRFLARYGAAEQWITPYIAAFPPEAVGAWSAGLGQTTFVGTSGRVFPTSMKASPLLRAWLRRLEALGVEMVMRASWTGWDDTGALRFADGTTCAADAVVLALGGASWPRLGSDGGWVEHLPGITLAPLRPANCGFVIGWPEAFVKRFAGTPLKRIALTCGGVTLPGELTITSTGIEGGVVYAVSAQAREMIERDGGADIQLDLRPDMTLEALSARLAGGRESLSTKLRKAGLAPAAIALVQLARHGGSTATPAQLVKALPLRLSATAGLARAISTAGGIVLSELDGNLMLRRRPGVFAAGEMLDWEAPTGGYLLQACLATGRAAGRGVVAWRAARA
jgi:uncharacterized flavoprotein (TIGR03862 family)